ncbi:hypothetical protein B0H14DRAFT_2841013 [Mycena olivaceomarginata]|nr:hypothetical protein B0H14DRAFT_2841013 [Mycena olivaceomarginata]
MFSKLSAVFKSAYAAITLNRVTVAFFVFSLVHCFAQGIIQSLLYSIDTEFVGVVNEIVHASRIPLGNMTYLEGSSNHWTLRMCKNIPHGQAQDPCAVVFQSGVDVNDDPDAVESDTIASTSILEGYTQGFSISTSRDSTNQSIGVTIKTNAASSVFLSHQCAQILVYPQQVLQNSVREDMTFIFFQFWILGVSVFAISRGSIPHMITALASRFLIAAWSGYIVIYRTKKQAGIFREIVSAPGTPCGGRAVPHIFHDTPCHQSSYDSQIADAILSFTALFLAGLLSWNILKVFKAQSFKRVGAPEHVIRIYKFFMAVQAVLQLEVFVLVVATRTAISLISTHTPIYNALVIATTVLVIPWIALVRSLWLPATYVRLTVHGQGWYGVRRERKGLIISFLAVGFFFISGWAIMFYSIVYRWSFLQWPYLGCFTVASFILIFASMALGTICWRNFDKGLTEYLNAEDALADLNFTPEVFQNSDVEKSGEKSKDFYAYDELDFPLATFHSGMLSGGETMRSDESRIPTPKPYITPGRF